MCLSLLTLSVSIFQTNLRRRRLVQTEPCVVLLKAERFDSTTDKTVVVCELQGDDADMSQPHFVYMDGLDEEWATEHSVNSGVTTLYAPGATIDGNHLHIGGRTTVSLESSSSSIGYSSEENNLFIHTDGGRRRLARTSGDKSVLAVRVIASDSSTSGGTSTLRNKIFGTNGDSVNMVSQYRACSNNKLRFRPSSTGNGVVTVRISRNARGVSTETVEDAVVAQLEGQYGNLASRFDHVMLCLPAGTGGSWVGEYNVLY